MTKKLMTVKTIMRMIRKETHTMIKPKSSANPIPDGEPPKKQPGLDLKMMKDIQISTKWK